MRVIRFLLDGSVGISAGTEVRCLEVLSCTEVPVVNWSVRMLVPVSVAVDLHCIGVCSVNFTG